MSRWLGNIWKHPASGEHQKAAGGEATARALFHRRRWDKGARGKTPVPFHLSGRKGDSPILLGAEARAAICSERDRKD